MFIDNRSLAEKVGCDPKAETKELVDCLREVIFSFACLCTYVNDIGGAIQIIRDIIGGLKSVN